MQTIVAISTPYGTGGIAVVRLSGSDALEIADRAWRGKPLSSVPSHTAHLGTITADDSGAPLDQAVATVFRAPNSFTGEDTVEFSVHGSKWIQRQVVERLVSLGAVPAGPGEFTQRAFMNGRMDLAQAEGVADLIAASSRAAHRLAMSQVSGGFSTRLNQLRERLIELASLLELELDFSEEDVEFADRTRLREIADETLALIERLVSTYDAGRAFKEGVPVAIAGRPNAGKSTLLNALLGEDKAIVSDVPGTTRDVIEDTREINGILFRFYDTAGLRDTDDTVERMGIDRARDAISRAAIVLWVIDASAPPAELAAQLKEAEVQINAHPESKHLLLLNKTDMQPDNSAGLGYDCGQKSDTAAVLPSYTAELVSNVGDKLSNSAGLQSDSYGKVPMINSAYMSISAKSGAGLAELEKALSRLAKSDHDPDAELIITNARHKAALESGAAALRRARCAMDTGLTADFIAQDVRESLHHLGTVTGAITPTTLLTSIFTHFCIGK